MQKNKTDTNKKGRKAARILAGILALLLVAGGGYRLYTLHQHSVRARKAMAQLEKVVPGLGTDTGISRGAGRDQLSAITLGGTDIVGVIEIPALNIMAPVTGKGLNEACYATWLDGSPVQEHFRIIGGRWDLFRKLARLRPGDNVAFTDVDGVRYNYRVTTQYHIKKWDMGENDLQLCYETDDDTYFCVGCGLAD